MEQEIDLRPYMQAVVRGWRLILGLVAGLCLVAVLLSVMLPRPARARGDLLIIPRSAQLSLDARFTERDATMITNALNQRQALIDLASSSLLEARVADELGLKGYEPGDLLERISVAASSDLIQIVAADSDPNGALRLAETWTRSYEGLVNELYSGADVGAPQIEAQIGAARQRFDAVQDDLDAFYAGGDLVRSKQQVQRLTGLLEGGSAAQLRIYTEYLSRTQELSLILEDARSLQAQYEAGGADLGAGLSALAVRARLAGAAELPVQLSFASAESFAAGQVGAADLAQFVQVLAGERDRMVAQADALARDLAAGNSDAVGLPAEVRARYEADLAAAQGALARAEGQEKQLLLQREVALRSLEVLQSRGDESQIAQAAPDVRVRYVGVAFVPPRSLAASLVVSVVAAIALGSFLALAWIIGREILRRRTPAAPAGVPVASQADRSADRPVASD